MPPFLTDDEIAEMCKPLKQGAAQIRFLKSIGVPVTRRPDGRPLVLRHKLMPTARQEPNWRVSADDQPAWGRAKSRT